MHFVIYKIHRALVTDEPLQVTILLFDKFGAEINRFTVPVSLILYDSEKLKPEMEIKLIPSTLV